LLNNSPVFCEFGIVIDIYYSFIIFRLKKFKNFMQVINLYIRLVGAPIKPCHVLTICHYKKKRLFSDGISDGKVPFSGGNLNLATESATEYRCRIFAHRCPVSDGIP